MEWMLMPLRRYAEFTGRSRRKEYWMFALFIVIGMVLFGGLMFAGGLPAMMEEASAGTAASPPGPIFWLGALLFVVFALATVIPSISVGVRRLHDRDLSGWWYLGAVVLGAIPYIGTVASLVMLVVVCLPGTPGPNRFGPDPKDPSSAEVFA